MKEVLNLEEKQEPDFNNMKTLKEYALETGVSYETIRRNISKNKSNPDLMDHIFTKDNKRYLDQEAEIFLENYSNNKNRVNKVVIEDSPKIKELQSQLAAKDIIISQKDSIILEYQQRELKNANNVIDTSKYIAIEDHQKTEEELQRKENEIKELSEEKNLLENEKKDLEKTVIDLKDVSVKNAKLTEEIKQKTEDFAQKEIENNKLKNEIDKKDAEYKRLQEKLEEERKRLEQESIDNLNLGFWGRMRKRKELKNKIKNND